MSLQIKGLCKSFGEHRVLKGLEMTLEDGGIYCLMGASGMGKTTLLHILLGLEDKDSGEMIWSGGSRISAMFQENRLCEDLTAPQNAALVCKGRLSLGEISKRLSEILPEECLSQPVRELSGGMKRRAALARAMLFDSELIIMDEPFTGLDRSTKKEVIDFILRMRGGRTLLISTHNEEDVSLLGGTRLELGELFTEA